MKYVDICSIITQKRSFFIGFVLILWAYSARAMDFNEDSLKALALEDPRAFIVLPIELKKRLDQSDEKAVYLAYKAFLNAIPNSVDRLSEKLFFARELKSLTADTDIGFKKLILLFKTYFELHQTGIDGGLIKFVKELVEHNLSHKEHKVCAADLSFAQIITSGEDIGNLVGLSLFSLENKIIFAHEYYGALLSLRGEEIARYLQKKLPTMPVYSRSGVRPLHELGYDGKGLTIALCDAGFSASVQNIDNALEMQWDLLNEDFGSIEPIQSYINAEVIAAREKLTIDHLAQHGRKMTKIIHAIAPGVRVRPIEIDEGAESWSRVLTSLANDASIQIINASWPMPGLGDLENEVHLMDPGCKGALINCLEKGKIVVLAAGNVGRCIPAIPGIDDKGMHEQEAREAHNDTFWRAYYNSCCRISDLFQDAQEDSPLFSNVLVVGSSKKNSLETQDGSVTSGRGPAQRNYVYADGDTGENNFFASPQWGGTSTSTAIASGLVACLWQAASLQIPGSHIVSAILATGDKDNTFDPNRQGMGKINAMRALKNLGK